jgi:hypothetical protein
MAKLGLTLVKFASIWLIWLFLNQLKLANQAKLSYLYFDRLKLGYLN